MIRKSLLLVCGLLMLLSGCGFKGPLYLPKEQKQGANKPAASNIKSAPPKSNASNML